MHQARTTRSSGPHYADAPGERAATIETLNREIVRVMALPEIKERMAELGFEIVASTPDEFSTRIRSEIPKWAKVIRNANIKADQ